jgi:Cu+-exporting ATPase
METDPVCGMRVAPASAAGRATFAGETFFFCSATCRDRFNERPEDYAAPAGRRAGNGPMVE